MQEVWKVLKKLFEMNIVQSILVVFVNLIIYKVILHFVAKGEKSSKVSEKLNNKSKTYLRLMKSILRYIFIIITVLMIMQINGVNVSSMLAGVGIASVIIGLAVQDALKDIIRGFSILSAGYFRVGDVVKYGDVTGKVEVLGLNTTKIRELATGNLVSIANRNIEQIQVVSGEVYVNVPLPYEVKIDRAEEVMGKIVEKIKENKDIKSADYIGVNELADSSIKYLLKVVSAPESILKIKRYTHGCVLRVLEQEDISVPYNQLDIHQK
ncbi:MAG: mechanosensitive ion channel family protein [Clostridia bacterium]|nr:mechanosensitive ion channel family protein [Clostridia bacterium]